MLNQIGGEKTEGIPEVYTIDTEKRMENGEVILRRRETPQVADYLGSLSFSVTGDVERSDSMYIEPKEDLPRKTYEGTDKCDSDPERSYEALYSSSHALYGIDRTPITDL